MDDGRKKPLLVVGSGKLKKAVRPSVPATTTQPPARAVQLKTPLPPPDAAAGVALAPPQRQLADDDDEEEPVEAVDESAAAADQEEQDADEEDDEQVERFYALLASIRAMRGLPPAPCTVGTTGVRKRTTRAEPPPWTPAFRMEDFEERPSPRASSSKRQRQAGDDGADVDDGGGRERPAVVVVTPPPLPHAADRLDDDRRRAAMPTSKID